MENKLEQEFKKKFRPYVKDEHWLNMIWEWFAIQQNYNSIPVELPVSGDFCGDCKRVIYEDEDRFTGGTSSTYGVYYEANSKPICGHCINVRFENRVREFESKNSR